MKVLLIFATVFFSSLTGVAQTLAFPDRKCLPAVQPRFSFERAGGRYGAECAVLFGKVRIVGALGTRIEFLRSGRSPDPIPVVNFELSVPILSTGDRTVNFIAGADLGDSFLLRRDMLNVVPPIEPNGYFGVRTTNNLNSTLNRSLITKRLGQIQFGPQSITSDFAIRINGSGVKSYSGATQIVFVKGDEIGAIGIRLQWSTGLPANDAVKIGLLYTLPLSAKLRLKTEARKLIQRFKDR